MNKKNTGNKYAGQPYIVAELDSLKIVVVRDYNYLSIFHRYIESFLHVAQRRITLIGLGFSLDLQNCPHEVDIVKFSFSLLMTNCQLSFSWSWKFKTRSSLDISSPYGSEFFGTFHDLLMFNTTWLVSINNSSLCFISLWCLSHMATSKQIPSIP